LDDRDDRRLHLERRAGHDVTLALPREVSGIAELGEGDPAAAERRALRELQSRRVVHGGRIAMPSPTLVRTIVCSYTRDELPAAWLAVFRRFERVIERAGLRVRVRLDPLEELPERLRRVEQQIRAFKELHASELQIVLDELADIAGEVEASRGAPLPGPEAPVDDPAANSPKRAKWLAEQERKQRPQSRRELLFGRGEEPRSD